MKIKMSEQDYQNHCEEMNGVCISCGAIRYGDTEGDAENYPCEECGEDMVQGIENALIEGNIIIVSKVLKAKQI